MEIRISQKNLLQGVQKMQGIAEIKGAMPILSYFLLSTDGDGVILQATDLEVGVRVHYPANVIQQGKVALQARKIGDIVRELPDEEIHLAKEENNWVTIKCGKAVFRLPGMPAADCPAFPAFNDAGIMSFKGAVFKDMVRKTAFAVSPDESRKGLSSLLLESADGRSNMIGSDGHRLAFISRPLMGGATDGSEKQSYLLPRKSLPELLKFLEDEPLYSFSLRDNHFAFVNGKQVMVARVMEGKFPNFRQFIPANNDIFLRLNKNTLLHALKRVSLLADDQSKMVRFEIQGKTLLLISDSTELGLAREEIPVDYQGREISVGMNARYVLDVLNVLDQEEIVLNLKDKEHGCLITVQDDKDFLGLIMPVRI